MSFANTEVLPRLAGWFRPLIGRDTYNKKNVEDAQKATGANLKVLEEHLTVNTYLVSERLTLADLFTASIAARGFEFFFDKQWRAQHPAVTRWYETVSNQDIFKAVAGETKFIDTAIPNTPPKTEKPKAEKPKEAPKPKAAAPAEDEEEDAPPAPKPKHPLEALPRPTFVLDDWYVKV
jgi:elongation factor 1-gamma